MTPQIENRDEQPYVVIPIRVPMREWGKANALVAETIDWILGRGLTPSGAPFFRYRVIGDMDEPFELEVGFPLAEAVEGDDRVLAGSKPAGAYAVLVHEGHPDGMAKSHAALRGWASGEGVPLAGSTDGTRWSAMFESYLTDPRVQPDLDEWSTELAYLIDDVQR